MRAHMAFLAWAMSSYDPKMWILESAITILVLVVFSRRNLVLPPLPAKRPIALPMWSPVTLNLTVVIVINMLK